MSPGPPRGLSHREIVDVALDALSKSGLGGVSLRGVARAADVAPAALYTYFAHKQALMSAMVEQVLGSVDLPDPPAINSSSRTRLLALATSVHATLAAQPGAAGLIMSGPLDGPNALRLNERLLEDFGEAGLGPADAARAAYALQVYVLGSVALTSAGAQAGDTHLTTPPDGAAEEFPLSAAAADIAAQYDSPGQFGWGLKRLVDGIIDASHTS